VARHGPGPARRPAADETRCGGRTSGRSGGRRRECSRRTISGSGGGHSVVDIERNKIGELEAIYVDTKTDQPSFATVKTGMLKARLVFVPLAGAKVGPDYLKVAYPRTLVRDAPSIDTDGELLAAGESAIFSHYDLPYGAGESERLLARR
jgi:PRC-barrel domain